MLLKMKEGQVCKFMGQRIQRCLSDDHIGKRRCEICAFSDMPDVCFLLRCWPTKRTQYYYRVCDGTRYIPSWKRGKTLKNNTYGENELSAAQGGEVVPKGRKNDW